MILFPVHQSRMKRVVRLWNSDYQSEDVMEEEEEVVPSVEESSKPRRSAKRCTFVPLYLPLGFTELTKEKVDSTESSEVEYELDQEAPVAGEANLQDSIT